MRSLNFRIVNVFTFNGGALTGNPLCVFEDARDLDTETMQALARQFNLSETTFIQPSSSADAHVRIFTPSYEMPFAGHPTLGTAFVCRELGLGGDRLRLEMQAGIIPVSRGIPLAALHASHDPVQARGDRWTLQANQPTWRACEASRDVLAAMLGLEVGDIGEQPLWIKAGKEQLVIPLTSEAAVRRAAPKPDLFGAVKSEDGHSMAYIFAPPTGGRTLARFFFPDGPAILEDPATGSATANFGGWWLATDQPLPCQLQISQGEYVARPSTLYLQVDSERRILVSGDVIEIARGTLQLPDGH